MWNLNKKGSQCQCCWYSGGKKHQSTDEHSVCNYQAHIWGPVLFYMLEFVWHLCLLIDIHFPLYGAQSYCKHMDNMVCDGRQRYRTYLHNKVSMTTRTLRVPIFTYCSGMMAIPFLVCNDVSDWLGANLESALWWYVRGAPDNTRSPIFSQRPQTPPLVERHKNT